MPDSILKKIKRLLNLKFEGHEAGFGISGMDEEQQELERQLLHDVAVYRARLEAMPENELDMEIEFEESRVLAEQRQRPFFHQPNADADFAMWINMPTWTSDQATALLFGKEPSIVHWGRVEEHLPSDFARRYAQLRASLESSQAARQLASPATPRDIIDWARDRGIPIPPRLMAAAPMLTAPEESISQPSEESISQPSKGSKILEACMDAIEQLYGPVEPKGVKLNDRDRAINSWLRQKGQSRVSMSTIKRAWKNKYGTRS